MRDPRQLLSTYDSNVVYKDMRRFIITSTIRLLPFAFLVIVILNAVLFASAQQSSSLLRRTKPPIELLSANDTRKLSNKKFVAAVKRFHDWFSAHYGSKLLVKLVPVEGARLGVEAQVPIRPGQAYLSVPLRMCIDEKSLTAGEHAPPGFAAYWSWLRQQRDTPSTPVQLLLATYLIWARWVAPPNSTFWEPYVELLPRKMETPEHTFTDGDFRLLAGLPRMATEIKRQRQQRAQEFHWMNDRVAKKNAAFGAGSASPVLPDWALTRGRWSWAMSILYTRMIWWDGGPHLVPMLDMVNCDPGPKQEQPHVHQTVREGDRAVTRAGWAFKKGDEILENYGQHNYYYFTNHGFFLDYNPHDCYNVDLPPVTRDVTRRAMFLTKVSLDRDDMQLCFSLQNQRRLTTAIDVARVYTLPDKALEEAILKRELPQKDTVRQMRKALRFLGKAIKTTQIQIMEGTLNKFDAREPEMEDTPHAALIKDYANMIGLRMDDDKTEIRRRMQLLTEKIRVSDSASAADKIKKQKELEERQRKAEEEASAAVEKEQESTMSEEERAAAKQLRDALKADEDSTEAAKAVASGRGDKSEAEKLAALEREAFQKEAARFQERDAYGLADKSQPQSARKRSNVRKSIRPLIDDDF